MGISFVLVKFLQTSTNLSTKMKFILVAVCLVAAACAAPSSELLARRALPALAHDEIHDEFGQYALRYVTAEGTIVSERGRLVPTPEGTGHVLVVDGDVTFVGDDGKTYITKYSAGLDGSKVEGTHLPVAPQPIPVPVL